MLRNNQNDLNFSPQEVGFSGGGYGGYSGGAPVIAPTFVSAPSQPYAYAPPVAPIAPIAQSFGGGFGGFGGGFGGNGNWLELLIAAQLFGRDGFSRGGSDHGHFPFPFPNPCKDDDGDNSRGLAILAALAANKDTTVGEGRAVLAAIAGAKDATVAEGRAALAAFAVTNDNIKDAQFQSAIQAERNTAQLSQQAQAFAIQAANGVQSIKDQSNTQTALILARLNDAENQRLRDELLETRRRGSDRDLEVRIENVNTNTNAQLQAQAQLQLQRDFDEHRRRFDNREIEINNINTNTNVQAQLQAQAQRQAIVDLDREHRLNARFDALINQQNKVAQDIINVGSGVVGASQTANPTNVNSKNLQ